MASGSGVHTVGGRKSCRAMSMLLPVLMGCSHLLAQRCNVPGGFDDALSASLMLVQFVAESLEHWHEQRCWWSFDVIFTTGVLDACHDWMLKIPGEYKDHGRISSNLGGVCASLFAYTL